MSRWNIYICTFIFVYMYLCACVHVYVCVCVCFRYHVLVEKIKNEYKRLLTYLLTYYTF